MLGLLIRKELLDHLLSLRFAMACIICPVVVLSSVFVLARDFRDASFDRVICAEVMEHVHDYRGAARELARVLRPGGRLAVTIPTATSEHLYLRLGDDYFESPGGHIRIFQPRALAKFRQGFGRLLRTTSDRGCVFVLDDRILDPRHRSFLRELPLTSPGPFGAGGHASTARLARGDTDMCAREAFEHMDLTESVRRRGLSATFVDSFGLTHAAHGEPEVLQPFARSIGTRAKLVEAAKTTRFRLWAVNALSASR